MATSDQVGDSSAISMELNADGQANQCPIKVRTPSDHVVPRTCAVEDDYEGGKGHGDNNQTFGLGVQDEPAGKNESVNADASKDTQIIPSEHKDEKATTETSTNLLLPKDLEALDTSDSNCSIKAQNHETPLDKDTHSWLQMVLSWRFAITVMLLLSFVVNAMPRMFMPMALVCMTRPLTSSSSPRGTLNNVSASYESSSPESRVSGNLTSHRDSYEVVSPTTTTQHTETTTREFDWDSEIQGLILSASFFTVFLGPILSDILRRYMGNKWTMTLFTTLSTVITILSPVSARVSPYLLVAVRVVQGVSLVSQAPIVGDTLVWWAPQAEKLILSAVAFSGLNFSGVFAYVIAGYLCAIPIDNGWPFVFYVFGIYNVLWIIAWIALTSRKPEDHRFISEKEKRYIISRRRGLEVNATEKEKTPYKKIFTSLPVLVQLFTSTCHVWIMYAAYTYLPTYMNNVLQIPVETVGIIVSTIAGVRIPGAICWSAASNSLISSGGMNVNRSRKICIVGGFLITSVALGGLAFMDAETKWVAVALLFTMMISHSVGSSVLISNHLDMAPRYAGFLTGLDFCQFSITSISAPLVISALIPTNSALEWRYAWIVMTAVMLAGTLAFAFLGDVSRQPWATPIAKQEVMTPLVDSGLPINTAVPEERPAISTTTIGDAV